MNGLSDRVPHPFRDSDVALKDDGLAPDRDFEPDSIR